MMKNMQAMQDDSTPWRGAERTAAYRRPESACDTSRLTLEHRRATDLPGTRLPPPSSEERDQTVPRTAGRTEDGRSPDGSSIGRASPAPGGAMNCVVHSHRLEANPSDRPARTTSPLTARTIAR